MAVAFKHHPAKCPPCPTEPKLRRIYGCDGRSIRVVCSCGGGHGRSCGVCEDGWLTVTRCPASVPEEVWAVHEAYAHYRSGFLPVAGGVMDQSMGFMAAVRMLDRLYARHEEIELKDA